MSASHKQNRASTCHDCTRPAAEGLRRCVPCNRKHNSRRSAASRGKGPLAICEQNLKRLVVAQPGTPDDRGARMMRMYKPSKQPPKKIEIKEGKLGTSPVSHPAPVRAEIPVRAEGNVISWG